MSKNSALDLIRRPDRLTLGIELPLDNDWSPAGEARRVAAGRPRGVPDLSAQTDLVRKADALGFAAVWMRDVPVFDVVNMGDAGSVYDVFALLGYFAGLTRNVALGTAAVVLPIRHPLMTAKAAASVDALSVGRLILGVASGDRPVEYPLLGLDVETRGEAFREAVAYLRAAWQPGGLPVNGERIPTLDILPRPAQQTIPLVVAGQARQDDDWLAATMDGRFVYPGSIEKMAAQAARWRDATDGRGTFISAFHLDLLDAPDAPATPIRFGARVGRDGLIAHLTALADIGVDHLAINLRQPGRPPAEIIEELASDVTAGESVAIIIDDDFRHPASKIVVRELDRYLSGVSAKAVPQQLRKSRHRLRLGLPGDEIISYRNGYVLLAGPPPLDTSTGHLHADRTAFCCSTLDVVPLITKLIFALFA